MKLDADRFHFSTTLRPPYHSPYIFRLPQPAHFLPKPGTLNKSMKLKLVAAAASVTSPSSVLPVFLSATAFVATSHVSLASSASTFAFATAFRPSPHFARSFHFHSPSTTAKIATTATTSMKTRRSLTSKDAAPATPSLEPAPSKKRRKAGRMKKEDSDDVVDNEKATTGPWYTSFTKGDEQYERYMATEWGFEKVGFERSDT